MLQSQVRKSVLPFLFAFLIAGQAFAADVKPLVYKLPNGLTVVLKEDHASPVAAFQMWVRVGSADEPAQYAGVAHVFEHMLFKGTKKRAVGQIGREVSAAGGDINAYTSNDQTVYHLVLASRYFDTGLDILSDAVQNSSFDPVELKKELEVVVEEINRGEDNADRALDENIDRAAYQVHPYGRPVIGTKESVRSLTRDEILSFFHKWYVPNNMTLVIVGDFKIADARRKIAASLAGFKPGTLVGSRPQEPPQTAMRVTQETLPFQQEKLGLAFHIPDVKKDDAYALDVLADILSGGSTGLLEDRIVNKLSLATGVYAYSYTPLDPGLFTAGATLDPKNRERVIREALRVLFDAAHGDIPAKRLALAKTRIASDFIYRLESVQGLAGQLGYFQSILGDVGFQERYLRIVNGLTVDAVAAVARKYITPANLTVGIVSPQGTAPADVAALKRMVDEEWQAAEQRPRALRVTERRQDGATTIVRFDNGTELLITPDRSLPIASISGAFRAGLRYEPAALSGIGSLTANMLPRGTENRTREQLSDELDAIGGSFGAGLASDTATVSLQYLTANAGADKGLALLADILLHPAFQPDELDILRKATLPMFTQREDNLFQLGLLQFLPAMFGKNGYGRLSLGDKSVVEKVTAEQVRDYYRSHYRADTFTVAVVGDVDPEEFTADYARLFAGHRAEGALPEAPIVLPEIGKPVTITVEKGKAQTHIFYGWRAVGLKSEDRYPLEVLNAIMAGMGGRLFLELRDKQSLAYSVTSLLPMRQEAGAYIVYMGSAPTKADTALAGIRRQIAILREGGVIDKEVEEAKRYLVGNQAVDLQTRGARSMSQISGEVLGLGFRFDTEVYPKKIDAVTVADVNRVARKYLDPDKYVLVLVK
jgi:zinc protease